MTLLVKQAEFAARHRMVPSAFNNWKKRGLLLVANDPDRPGKRMIDVTKSDLPIKETIDPTRGRPRTEAGRAGGGPAEVRTVPVAVNGLEAARLTRV